MTLVASQVRIPGTGEVDIRSVGGTAPTDPSTALTGATSLGYTQPDGVTISRTVDREGIEVWQSTTPVKYIYNGLTLSISSAFVQSQNAVASLWFGAEFESSGDNFKAELSTNPSAIERSVALRWTDDEGKHHMIYIPRAEVGETGDVAINRQGATAFQITFEALTPDSGPLAVWLTDDPNFDPNGSSSSSSSSS